MHKWQISFLITSCFIVGTLSADPPGRTFKEQAYPSKPIEFGPILQPRSEEVKKPQFIPFTGKIAKNKVRLRALPTMDSPIVKELSQGDFLIVEGEEEEFYAVAPPEDCKGYVFRTFVLDGMIEGSKVNVRLEPSTDSPIIAQLNSGDRVEGKVSSINNKWMEISLPQTVRFYVSRDFVKKAGDKNYMALMQKKGAEVKSLLAKANEASQAAYKTEFSKIDYDSIIKQYERIIVNYPEFEEDKLKAEGLLNLFKENYIKMKIAYLEAKSGMMVHAEKLEEEKHSLEEKMREQQQRLAQLEQQVHIEQIPLSSSTAAPLWLNTERKLYLAWMEREGNKPIDAFYQEQRMEGVTLRGTIEPYLKKVKNKPGDYLLLNQQGRPVAFLYSTLVNLDDLSGRDVILIGSERSNNDFAFPAYFVLSAE